ncbi:hypothetical protein ACFRJ1_04575 [Streptomyces sp. NPDC056773]|uniref:hypothetical protein n=1 Tax=unclassified Streptomyces TaxID=2593676 RepID=UPI0036D1278C
MTLSVGNEAGGDGATFVLVQIDEEQAEQNPTLGRRLLWCRSLQDAGVGDESLSFTSERFAHVVLRVGGIEAQMHTPKDGASPSAEAWAGVMERRIRSVLAGEQPAGPWNPAPPISSPSERRWISKAPYDAGSSGTIRPCPYLLTPRSSIRTSLHTAASPLRSGAQRRAASAPSP